DERLPRPGGESEEDALLASDNRLKRPLYGDVLEVARLKISAPILKRDGGEAVSPVVLSSECFVPQLFGAWVAQDFALGALGHIDAVDGFAVGGVRKANGELVGVVLRLRQALR